jgi:hypothetical protein
MHALFEFLFERPQLTKLKDELQDTVLFKDLSRPELNKVVSHAQLRSFKKGDHIFFEGDSGQALFIVLRGSVQIVRHVAGKHVPLATLKKGTFFGELALTHDLPRSASAHVTEDALLVCLFRHDFENIVKHYPKLGTKLLTSVNQILAQRLTTSIERTVNGNHK